MTPRFNIRFIASILCAGLLIATLAAPQARAENGEITRAIVGLAALGLIGAAILDAQDNARPTQTYSPPARQPVTRAPLVAPGRERRSFSPRARAPRALPARCLRNVGLAGQRTQIYDAQCLKYTTPAPMPTACKVELKRGGGRKVKGYAPRCLARRGWRL